MSAATTWKALQAALAINSPACQGDDRFTADTSEDDGALVKLCRACPVREPCAAWAVAAPRSQRFGFFAGVSRRGHTGRPRRADSEGNSEHDGPHEA